MSHAPYRIPESAPDYEADDINDALRVAGEREWLATEDAEAAERERHAPAKCKACGNDANILAHDYGDGCGSWWCDRCRNRLHAGWSLDELQRLAHEDAVTAASVAKLREQQRIDDACALVEVVTPRFACRNVDCPNNVQWAHTRCDECIETDTEER